jgi:hypothetical protein
LVVQDFADFVITDPRLPKRILGNRQVSIPPEERATLISHRRPRFLSIKQLTVSGNVVSEEPQQQRAQHCSGGIEGRPMFDPPRKTTTAK